MNTPEAYFVARWLIALIPLELALLIGSLALFDDLRTKRSEQ